MESARSNRSAATGLLGAAALSMVLSTGALAQDGGGTRGGPSGSPEAADKLKDVKITLNADEENLIDALRALMKSAKQDFLIDADLKAGTATVHFKDVPFKDALATILKVSTLPITYELKDGIYHFMRRVDPPVVAKPEEAARPVRPPTQTGKVPLDQLSAAGALRKLTGPYDTLPPALHYYSTLPASHGSVSSFGLSGSGLLQSNATRFNPDGSISNSGAPPINIFGLLRGLLNGFRR